MYNHCSCYAFAFIHLAAADTKTSGLFTKHAEICGQLYGNPPHFLYGDLRGEILVLYSSKYTACFNTDVTILFFDIQVIVHPDKFLQLKPTRCTNF